MSSSPRWIGDARISRIGPGLVASSPPQQGLATGQPRCAYRLVGVAQVAPDERMRLLIRAHVRFVGANPEFVRLMHEEGKRRGPRMRWLVDRYVKPMFEQLTPLLEGAQQEGLLPADVAPAHFAYTLIGAIDLIFHQAEECRRLTGVDPFDEAVVEEADFSGALERLVQRARLAYVATGGIYVDDAKSPVAGAIRHPPDAEEARLLFVASPGVRNYLQYGGHGILVYDVNQGHKFLRRIPFKGVDENGRPLNVKGICASEHTGRLYVSTLRHLICLDLVDDKVLWEKTYDAGCDRMSMAPDGSAIYLPSLEFSSITNPPDGAASS